MIKEQETKIDKIVENMSDKEIEDRIKQDEQEKAIEKLTNGEKIDFNTLVRMFKREGIENFVVTKKEYIETVLNMLKEKDEETEHYKKKNKDLSKQLLMLYKEQGNYNARIEKKNEELKRKDKIIDLMARAIDNYDSQLVINTFKDKEHVKEYFERKVEEER